MSHHVRRAGWALGALLAWLVMGAGGCATQEAAVGGGGSPAGIWRGGSAYEPGGDPYRDLGVRYVLTLIPLGDDRFAAIWEGSYVTPPGYARMTQYCGELVGRGGGRYECVGMAYFNTSAVFPPDTLPQVWAIHGEALMKDRDTLQITYDVFDVYDWKSAPFVDAPLFKPVPTPIVEIYRRFTVTSP